MLNLVVVCCLGIPKLMDGSEHIVPNLFLVD